MPEKNRKHRLPLRNQNSQPTDGSGESQGEDAAINWASLTDADWKKRLSSEQFRVARKHGTERAFSGKYYKLQERWRIQVCVLCELLFDSKEKFDSGNRMAHFWQPIDKEVVGESVDNKLDYPRTEVHCNQCDAHLGHVFNDAPQTPTGLRYCINSVCLVFVPRKALEKAEK